MFDDEGQEIFSAPIDADFSECVAWANDLIQRAEPKIIIAKLLAVLSTRNKGYSLDRELAHELERRNKKPSFKRDRQGSVKDVAVAGKNKRISKPKGSFKKFTSKQNKNVGQILNAMCTALKVERSEVGAIRLHDNYILVELMPLALSRLEQSRAGLSKFGLFPEKN